MLGILGLILIFYYTFYTYLLNSLIFPPKEKYHGFSGPQAVENRPVQSVLSTAYLQAGLELGFKVTDPNAVSQIGESLINEFL